MDKIKNSLFAFCLLGLLMISGCSRNNESVEDGKVITVKTVVVQQIAFANKKEYIGTVEEEQAVSLSFPLQGNLQMLQGREGQFVSKGAVLAEINTQSLKSVHSAALSTFNQAEDGMQRMQQLYDNGSLPEVQYVEVQTKLEQARSMEAVARKNLEDARLVAPFDGVIGTRHVEHGENVLPNQPVFTLLKVNKVLVKISVPETEIADIQLNTTVDVSIPALEGKRFEGRIFEKGIKAHAISHTYEVRCELNNPQNALLPGMVCRVDLQADCNYTMSIPNKCVQIANNGSKYVWLVSENIVSKRIIETGHLTADGVVVTDGLRAGEVIVADGFQKVVNGLKVNTK